MTPTPGNEEILTQLRAFLVAVLDADVVVVQGQPNRVPEPSATGFVVMQPPRFERLRTNVDGFVDVLFTGSIAGAVMTVTEVERGSILPKLQVFGVDVAAGTKIVEQISGTTGGPGTYTVSQTQTVGSRALSAGYQSVEQGAQATVRIDFHAADGSSGDMAQTVSTLLRDSYGVDQFSSQTPNYGVVPLHADDPKQTPFLNGEQQVEWRWSLDAMLQVNQVILVPMQFADSAVVGLVNVDVRYPAT